MIDPLVLTKVARKAAIAHNGSVFNYTNKYPTCRTLKMYAASDDQHENDLLINAVEKALRDAGSTNHSSDIRYGWSWRGYNTTTIIIRIPN